MPETKLKIDLMRHGKVLTTHNAVVKAKEAWSLRRMMPSRNFEKSIRTIVQFY